MKRLRRPSPETAEELQPRLWAAVIGLGLVAIYIVAFIAQNSGEVSLDFIFFSAHVGLIWLVLLGFVLGFLSGVLLSQLYRRRRRHSAG
jgi:uncharacterized integral membrane protein